MPCAFPSKQGGKTQLVLLDHGLYRQVDDAFRLQYAGLWRSLIFADVAGITRHSDALGAGHAVPLFAAMLTQRPWDQVCFDPVVFFCTSFTYTQNVARTYYLATFRTFCTSRQAGSQKRWPRYTVCVNPCTVPWLGHGVMNHFFLDRRKHQQIIQTIHMNSDLNPITRSLLLEP